MKKTDDLFQLIRSMSQGEKWHFRAFSGKHFNRAEKNYIRLFDAIARQTVYDEDKLRRKFGSEIKGGHFSAIKNYLYNQVLESLHAYHSEKSSSIKIKDLLCQVEVLFNRGLSAQALKLLHRAHKLAKDKQVQLMQKEMLRWERRLQFALMPKSQLEKFYDSSMHDEDIITEIYEASRKYSYLAYKVFALKQEYGLPRSGPELKKFSALFSHPLMLNEPKTGTNIAKGNFYYIKSVQHQLRGDMEGAYKCYAKVLDLAETRPDLITDANNTLASGYMTRLYNFLLLCIDLRKMDRYFEQKVTNLKALAMPPTGSSQPPQVLRDRAFINYHCIELRRCAITARFEEGLAFARTLITKIEGPDAIANTYLPGEPRLSLGLFYYMSGDYNASLIEINQSLNALRSPGLLIFSAWVKILWLILQFELGNMAVLEYGIKRVYYHLTKAGKLEPTDKLLLRFLKNELPKVYTEAALNTALKKLYAALKKLSADPFEKQSFAHLYLFPWLESRIQHRPLSDVIREKARMRTGD